MFKVFKGLGELIGGGKIDAVSFLGPIDPDGHDAVRLELLDND